MLVTEGELLDAAERYAHSVIDRKEFISIAEQWAKSLNDGKPIVSCRACKWWEILPKPDEDYIEWTPAEHIGKCTKILHQGMQNDIAQTKDDKSFIAGTFDGEDYSSGLITGAEFSCILFGRHGS